MNKFFLGVFVLIALSGLFFYFIQNPTSVASLYQEHKTFDLVVQDHKLISGPTTLNVKQGDRVTINITADSITSEGDEELHIHGYDYHVNISKVGKSSITFTATVSGRFTYELENSSTELGALEVQP